MLSKVTSRALRRREQCRGQLCMCVQSSRISFSAPRVCFRLFWRFYFAFYSSFSSRCSWIFLYGLYRTTQNGLCLLACSLARSLACRFIFREYLFIRLENEKYEKSLLVSILAGEVLVGSSGCGSREEKLLFGFFLRRFDDSQSCRCLSPPIKQDVSDIFVHRRGEGKWPTAR